MAGSEPKSKRPQFRQTLSDRGHPMPRRASPEGSVTLRHHRLARDASMRPETGSNAVSGSSPRRNSSGESHDTGQSDPKRWFDLSNKNAPAAFDHATMDVDPPFYQKQSDSSNEEMIPPARESAYHHVPTGLHSQNYSRPTMAQSSSAEDYRSVIDDLTIENKRLKDELKRYRQFGPELLRKDRLFEIKVHGLAGSKRRELESTLRDFAASLEGSPATSVQRGKKSSKHANRLQGSSSNSKHASSSSSHSRPVDSAYASMSTGRSSNGPNVNSLSQRPSFGRTKSSTDHKVETYLQDIPEGLFPRPVAMTDKEKKKLVVRRLEQLFTGRMSGKHRFSRNKTLLSVPEPVIALAPPQEGEACREARIESGKMTSTENLSTSNSNGENDVAGDRTGSGSGSNEHNGQYASPQTGDLAEQRATRPRDLDPDRVQVPSENMQYIRHLGVTAPKDLGETRFRSQDVSIDAEGWIHLNLLCNLAQLHILNVTPSYIRSAISEKSAKFQLSRDGRKIRWRGGVEGTKFSSDSSGNSSQRSPETEGTDGSNEQGQRKRQRKSEHASDPSDQSHNQTKLVPQNSVSSEGFHYKPLFLHNRSSSAETSMDETGSQASFGAVENSNMNSRSTGFVSGSGSSPRKKRRNDGAIIYYNGAPFCTDLSGDPGDVSPATYLASSSQDNASKDTEAESPGLNRTMSGSSLPFRPLVDGPEQTDVDMDQEPELVTDDGELSESDTGFEFPWCDNSEKPQLKPLAAQLEPCGLGGVTPEDHFAILVVTKQPIHSSGRALRHLVRIGSNETAASISSRIAHLADIEAHASRRRPYQPSQIPVQVVAQRYKGLKPLPLPPPAMFYPPFTETTESEDSGFEDGSADEEDDSDVDMGGFEAISQRVNPKQSDQDFLTRGAPGSDDDEVHSMGAKVASKAAFVPRVRKLSHGSSRPGRSLIQGMDVHPDSSGATAGGEASGYSSSEEDD
ncbi:hypothetical protein KVR01_007864 [Diaporthe batatas]|uniref:uncharacterized protein n=1 Tax=Diaporthe batatas TaxID=748121 RepID=UPI001D05519D|nr:uncharacterized protein KVR01_007864 [Diaporthe batatas]KAG8162099.1 hypothetical protein KVR01_007864 [Diaporthe batatas]